MSIVAIARRNWALRLSVVLNVCVLLYVCTNIGSSGPWIEEPPTNWAAAAPLQQDAYAVNDLVNGTQKGAAAASSSSASLAASATKDAAPGTNNNGGAARTRLVTTTPSPNAAKAESLDKSQDHPRNQTVFSCSTPLLVAPPSSNPYGDSRCGLD